MSKIIFSSVMEASLEAQIENILEKELYGFNEGCIGTSCIISVRGKEKAIRAIKELCEQWKKSSEKQVE